MQFIDLKSQQKRIRKQLNARIEAVLDHGQYIMGPEINELEARLADHCEVTHAIGCASGTDALLMALMALDVGPGDAIITSPFTFIATAEVIQLLGATPVFVDIDPVSFNMDPKYLETAIKAIEENDRTLLPLPAKSDVPLTPKGIIAVDLFGMPADYEAIVACAASHRLFVIEDAAQSFGAQYKGKMACSLGDIGCTSFFPAKPFGGYGDGGMCFTDDERTADILRSIRIHGKGTDKYDNIRIGLNGRLDTLQAAILLAKFDIFPEEVRLRNEAAKRYATLLEGIDSLTIPTVREGYVSVWAQYSLLAKSKERRKAYQTALTEAGVPTAIYYPIPLHLQGVFRSLGYKPGDFPVSEDCSERIFSLPMHPYIDDESQEFIASVLNRV